MTYEIISERSGPDLRITQPTELIPHLTRYRNKRQEYFLAVTLSASQEVIRIHVVCIGLLNRTLIHPREVFIRGIKDYAASIILVHNHPSGSVEPSREDNEATKRLASAGKLIGIEVLDHIIISKTSYYSYRENGTLFI